MKQKKRSVLDITGFFVRIPTQVKAFVLRTSAFSWVLKRKTKPFISNTGRFVCFNIVLYLLLVRHVRTDTSVSNTSNEHILSDLRRLFWLFSLGPLVCFCSQNFTVIWLYNRFDFECWPDEEYSSFVCTNTSSVKYMQGPNKW